MAVTLLTGAIIELQQDVCIMTINILTKFGEDWVSFTEVRKQTKTRAITGCDVINTPTILLCQSIQKLCLDF
jgi:hypothetical protein